jgi:hypothetical protein
MAERVTHSEFVALRRCVHLHPPPDGATARTWKQYRRALRAVEKFGAMLGEPAAACGLATDADYVITDGGVVRSAPDPLRIPTPAVEPYADEALTCRCVQWVQRRECAHVRAARVLGYLHGECGAIFVELGTALVTVSHRPRLPYIEVEGTTQLAPRPFMQTALAPERVREIVQTIVREAVRRMDGRLRAPTNGHRQ